MDNNTYRLELIEQVSKMFDPDLNGFMPVLAPGMAAPILMGFGVFNLSDKEFTGNLLNSAVFVIWGLDKSSDKSAILIKNNEKRDISNEDLEFVITHFKKKAENYQNEIIEQYIKADKPMHIYMQKQLGLVPYFNH